MANESLRLKIELLSQLLPVQYDCLEKCLLSGLQPTANRGGMLGPLLTRHAPWLWLWFCCLEPRSLEEASKELG
jgi:hypothetical protein